MAITPVGLAHPMTERWVEVARCPLYEVSDLGRVRRKGGKVLKPSQNSSRMGRRPGYLVISLCKPGEHDGRRHTRCAYVHQLVCEAFHGPRPDGHDVDHVDHDRSNNRAANVRWMPLRENRVRWKGPGRRDFVLAKEDHDEGHEPMSEEELQAWTKEMAAAGW